MVNWKRSLSREPRPATKVYSSCRVRSPTSQEGTSLVSVFFAAPVTPTVARMLMPSTRQAMICSRLSVLSLLTDHHAREIEGCQPTCSGL